MKHSTFSLCSGDFKPLPNPAEACVRGFGRIPFHVSQSVSPPPPLEERLCVQTYLQATCPVFQARSGTGCLLAAEGQDAGVFRGVFRSVSISRQVQSARLRPPGVARLSPPVVLALLQRHPRDDDWIHKPQLWGLYKAATKLNTKDKRGRR